MLRRLLATLAVLDFVGSVDAVDEKLAMPLDHLRDSQTFDDVGADSDYGRGELLTTHQAPAWAGRLEDDGDLGFTPQASCAARQHL